MAGRLERVLLQFLSRLTNNINKTKNKIKITKKIQKLFCECFFTLFSFSVFHSLPLCLSFSLSLSYIVNCFVYIKLYIYSIYLSSKQHVLHFANCLSYIPKHTLTHSPINYIYISDISVNIISIYIYDLWHGRPPQLSLPIYIHKLYIFLISVSICFVCAFLKGSILSLCLSFALLFFNFSTLIFFIVLSKKEKKEAKSTHHKIFSTPQQTPVICTQEKLFCIPFCQLCFTPYCSYLLIAPKIYLYI